MTGRCIVGLELDKNSQEFKTMCANWEDNIELATIWADAFTMCKPMWLCETMAMTPENSDYSRRKDMSIVVSVAKYRNIIIRREDHVSGTMSLDDKEPPLSDAIKWLHDQMDSFSGAGGSRRMAVESIYNWNMWGDRWGLTCGI